MRLVCAGSVGGEIMRVILLGVCRRASANGCYPCHIQFCSAVVNSLAIAIPIHGANLRN